MGIKGSCHLQAVKGAPLSEHIAVSTLKAQRLNSSI